MTGLLKGVPMETGSPPLDARSRKTLTVILKALASVGQRPTAECLGVDEATISRMKEMQLERFARLLTAVGLKPVPVDARCYSEQHIESLEFFAKRGIATEEGDSELHFEDPE